MKKFKDDIDTILDSLDGIKRMPAPADFQERLFETIAELAPPLWIRWFQYGVAAMLILAAVNIITLIDIQNTDELSRSQVIELITTDIMADDQASYFETN
jgi:hypothetical protein